MSSRIKECGDQSSLKKPESIRNPQDTLSYLKSMHLSAWWACFSYYKVVFYMWVEDTPSVLEHTSLYICHSKGKKIAPDKKICKEGFWLAPLDHMLPLPTVFTRITWFGRGSSSTTKEEVAIFGRNEGKQDSWLSKEMIYQRSCRKWGTDSGLEWESIK